MWREPRSIWFPDFVVDEELRLGRLVAVLDSECREMSQINIVLPARQHVQVKVRELMRLLEKHVAARGILSRPSNTLGS